MESVVPGDDDRKRKKKTKVRVKKSASPKEEKTVYEKSVITEVKNPDGSVSGSIRSR